MNSLAKYPLSESDQWQNTDLDAVHRIHNTVLRDTGSGPGQHVC